jgi:hypothetical protein
MASPGNYTNSIASLEEMICPAGTFQPLDGAGFCFESSPGYFVSVNGSNKQIPCWIGTFQPSTGSIGCEKVIDGTYADQIASTEAKECEAGFFRDSIANPAGNACLPAPAGHYSSEPATPPLPCPQGTFAEFSGSTSINDCLPAPVGTFVDSAGSDVPKLCPPGTFQPEVGATSCIQSPINSFVNKWGSQNHTPCSKNGITLSKSSNSSTDCIFDQDKDGIVDENDRFVYFKGDDFPPSVAVFSVAFNSVLVLANMRRDDEFEF